jgi:aminoglycoside phosphotransferase (APT) family kinase protein
VKNIIAASFPRFRGMRVELLGEGWDFRLFEVGERWLLRFPKHEGSVTKLKMELKLLAGLGEWVSLPIPNYEYYGRSGTGSGRSVAGYRKLPGVSGDLAEKVDRPQVAQQLGLFLGTLHTYPLNRAEEAGVREESDMVAHWRQKAFEGLKRIVDFEANTHRLHQYLSSNPPSPFEGTPRLVHNDLWAEHILINPSGSVSGIIDWGDAVIGDPAVVFAGLYTWYGERWLKRVLEVYPGALTSELISRARYLATCLAIHNVALGQALGRSQWVEAGEKVLRWIFAK